mmetsp:Transcript_15580/g.36735  ORF Transcript_15580/g.36735 Transcript_15580/m.36735 type:complete len:247 (-) Transcript_15580:1116-1856(-)
MLAASHDHHVYEHTWDVYATGIKRAVWHDLLHLHNHQTTIVLGSHRLIQGIQQQRLSFEGHIASFVCNRTSQECNSDLGGRIKDILLGIHLHNPHDVFGCLLVAFTSSAPWIRKSVQADLGQMSRDPIGCGTNHMTHLTHGQVPALDFARKHGIGESRAHIRPPKDGFGHQWGELVSALAFTVADNDGEHHLQIPGMLGLVETLAQSSRQSIARHRGYETRQCHTITIHNCAHGLICGNHLRAGRE